MSPWQITWAGPASAVGFFCMVKTIVSDALVQPVCVPDNVKVTLPFAISPGLKV